MQVILEQDIFVSGSQTKKVNPQDTKTISILASEAAFEQVFKAHFKALHSYALTILKDTVAAEEVVQNVFFKIWEKKRELVIESSVKAYLYRAVHNESLNVLKHEQVKFAHQTHTAYQMKNETDSAAKKILAAELETKFRKALNELPEQCRTIFQLSRFEELKYQQIADHLGLSIKTVENQMGKALKLLRLKLVDFLPLIALTLLHLLNGSH
jgi:RNA polymerase sigma-70 factor, ECF subfamily